MTQFQTVNLGNKKLETRELPSTRMTKRVSWWLQLVKIKEVINMSWSSFCKTKVSWGWLYEWCNNKSSSSHNFYFSSFAFEFVRTTGTLWNVSNPIGVSSNSAHARRVVTLVRSFPYHLLVSLTLSQLTLFRLLLLSNPSVGIFEFRAIRHSRQHVLQ